jgi:hypothetical protein
MNGLPVINGDINIIDIAVADTGTSYSSGIYIIADTAVYNYNWYTDSWYALSNDGLIRKNDTVQLTKISAFGKGSSTDQTVFCIRPLRPGWPMMPVGDRRKCVRGKKDLCQKTAPLFPILRKSNCIK